MCRTLLKKKERRVSFSLRQDVGTLWELGGGWVESLCVLAKNDEPMAVTRKCPT